MSDTFVIFDTEYTTWEGAMGRGWSGENEYRELVHLAAIEVDRESLEEVGHLDLFVKPKRNPILSDYFIDLTKITNEMIDEKGQFFEEAIKIFHEFCHYKTVFSYGNDMMILAQNIVYYNVEELFLDKIFFKNWADFFYQADAKTKKVNSGRLAAHFNVDSTLEGIEHNALYDCRSQLEAFKYLYQKGHAFSF